MAKRLLACALTLVVVLSTAACGGPTGEENDVHVPTSSGDLEGQQFEEVLQDLRAAGFTHVESVALEDLITGWLNGPGEVKSVEIGGESDFTSADGFRPGVEVIVSYHSFPDAAEAAEEPSEVPTPTALPTTAPTVPTKVLTEKNNADLSSLMKIRDYCSEDVADFSDAHRDESIKFEGNIGAINLRANSSTRYDILIGPGKYDENAQRGPAFQFRDVNTTSDLNFVGPNIPDSIGVGDNFQFTARVVAFEGDSCLFLLDPISTFAR